MRSHELLFRLREKTCSELERAGLYPSQVAAPRELKEYLANVCADRFYPAHRRFSLNAAAEGFPSWMGRAVSAGNRLCSHEVEQLRLGSIQLGNPIDWHRDPATGRLLWIRTRREEVVGQASWPVSATQRFAGDGPQSKEAACAVLAGS